MGKSRLAMVGVAAGALIAAPVLEGATVKNGSPKLADYRGKPLAAVFFHPF